MWVENVNNSRTLSGFHEYQQLTCKETLVSTVNGVRFQLKGIVNRH